MKVLSLFDGISCGRIALERAGIPVKKYYASEVDKYAEKISEANYPDIVRLGDVTKWREWEIEQPDLICAGSPCQGFSFAGKQLNFSDPRSSLFFEFVNILNHYKPKYFLLENVKMKKEHQDIISKLVGFEPIEINSALVSAQNRKRLYWTNISGIEQPEDKGIVLNDVVDTDNLKHEITINHPHTVKYGKNYAQYDQSLKGHNSQEHRFFYLSGKSNCITRSRSSVPKVKYNGKIYLVNIGDVESMQTIPIGYTRSVVKTVACEAIGNGWTVDVIAHIFKNMK